MAKYKFTNEDENKNKLTFKDLDCGDIFIITGKKCFGVGKIPRMKIAGHNDRCMIDICTGIQCEIADINCEVKKYTGTLVFDEKDWTDKK